jgi:feruloyl esterase
MHGKAIVGLLLGILLRPMMVSVLSRVVLVGACVVAAMSTPSSATGASATASVGVLRASGAAVPVITCAQLAKSVLPNASITSAQSVTSGQYHPSESAQRLGGGPGRNLAGRTELGPNPAFCRIAATLRPSSDSDIKIEVWLPQSGWNGKLLTAGNSGWGGSLMYVAMLTALKAGFATASTDTGHDGSMPDGNGGKFSLGHPEKLVDYAYRAYHDLTVDAKALIEAFYGVGPSHSYWVGCSLGGLEGLIEAKRYPADYDGVVAGAPPNPITRFNALQVWPDWLISQDARRLIPQSKYAMIHEAVLKACSSPVGLKDGLVERPDRCDFDPIQLQCRGADGEDCLTSSQVYLLRQTYAGPHNSRTKELIFPGPARGSELEMFAFANGKAPDVALDLFRYAAFQNTTWNLTSMHWDNDVTAAIRKIGPLMHVDSDLKPFFNRGGKLLMYIGWNDYHNPEQLIEYYKAVVQHGGEQARDSVRLFTVPGMNHCLGGAGCDTFDKLGVIDAWVELGTAPQRIIAAKIDDEKIVRTRPLCAYPQVAKYTETGDIDDAVNFACVAE